MSTHRVLDLVAVEAAARQEIYHEELRAAVERRKQELRANPARSVWRQLADWLPFTISIRITRRTHGTD